MTDTTRYRFDDLLDLHVALAPCVIGYGEVTPARFQELVTVFRDATRLEIDFWAMGLERRA